jgi:hypothetical protein
MNSDTQESASWKGAHWIWLQPDGAPNNVHALCRKTFSFTQLPRRAVCRITANTAYELYLNGRWVGRGPVRSDPAWQYVDAYDVTAQLVPGDNVLAVHAYHHGEDHVGAIISCAGPGGLLVKLVVESADGKRVEIATDGSWHMICAPQYAVDTGFVTWHREDYKETYDARLEPAGWQTSVYDDRSWPSAFVRGAVPCPPWMQLIPNPLPPLTHEPVHPVNVFTHHSGSAYGFCKQDVTAPESMLSDDEEASTIAPVEPDFDVQILFDFGKAVVGRFHLDIADAAGGDVFISYGDSLNLTRIDHLILRPGAQHYQPCERRFGRYVMLTLRRLAGPVRIRRAWFELITYPVEPRGAFACSDPMLNRIWDVGCWTLRMNMNDQFEDCPFREQMLYCGDLRVSAQLAYYAFGDYALARESLRKLARVQRENGLIPNVGPTANKDPKSLPEFPALWLIALHDYWLHSGDAALVAELWPNVKKLLAWYAQWRDESGLMRQLPTELRGDFVDNLAGIPMDGPVLAIQCFYYLALRAAERMAKVAGDPGAARACDHRANELAKAVNARFWDKRLEGYLSCLSGLGEKRWGLTPDLEPDMNQPLSRISNGMALYAGLVPEERLKATLRTLLEPGRASPARSAYMSYYLAEALFRCHQGADAVRRIREYWGGMIERGATTFWEVFDPSTPEGRMPDRLWSLCHEFCAGPVHSLPLHILGVEPLEPGFRRARLAPVLGDLQWARGRIPTPMGPVEVSWRLADQGQQLLLEFTQPAGMEIEVEVPALKKVPAHLELDGVEVSAHLDAKGARLVLPALPNSAAHRIVLR